MKRLLIAGFGDLGARLSACLEPDDWQISGLKRRPEQLSPSVAPVAADLLVPETLAQVAGDWDAVIYQATPGERSPDAYRNIYVNGLAHLLDHVRVGRLIFVSSTAVYGQDDGNWVDEDSPTEPQAFNGRILLEAESLARQAGGQVVRFSGIYGPGRDYLLRQLRDGRAECRPSPPQWTNRIHADDCAGVLAHLLALEDPSPLYCATDCSPSPRCEVLEWLAARLGQPAPERITGGYGQGKRVSNKRLMASGYDFLYPDYRSGYGALMT